MEGGLLEPHGRIADKATTGTCGLDRLFRIGLLKTGVQ